MNMSMTMEEKNLSFARIINEHFLTQRNNPACVPVEHLNAKGFDVSDSRNALWRLREKGVITTYKHGWGFFEIRKTGKKVFVIKQEEDPNDDEGDFEAYEIEIVPEKLVQMIKANSDVSKSGDIVILNLNKEGDLFREPKEKFCYGMKSRAIPLKIFRHFIDNPNENYELPTKDVAMDLGMKSQRLRNEINKMRSSFKNSLGLDIDLFESRQGNGYRLNPKIKIIQES